MALFFNTYIQRETAASTFDEAASTTWDDLGRYRYSFGYIADGYSTVSRAHQDVDVTINKDLVRLMREHIGGSSALLINHSTTSRQWDFNMRIFPNINKSIASSDYYLELKSRVYARPLDSEGNPASYVNPEIVTQVELTHIFTVRYYKGSNQQFLLTKTQNVRVVPWNELSSANTAWHRLIPYVQTMMPQIQANICLNPELTYDAVNTSEKRDAWLNTLTGVVMISRNYEDTYSGWINSNSAYTTKSTIKEWIGYWLRNSIPEDDTDIGDDWPESPNTGDHNNNSDTYTRDDLPSINICASGFLTTYHVNTDTLTNLSSVLWDDNFVESIPKLITNPIDAIISFKTVPVAVESYAVTAPLKIASFDTGISSAKLTRQYVSLDFGMVSLTEYAGDFTDYSQTCIKIFLPYIGEHSLNVNDVMGSNLFLTYNIDLLSGACVAILEVSRDTFNTTLNHTVIGQWTGNVASDIPITSATYGDIVDSVTQLGTSILTQSIPGVVNSVSSLSSPQIELSGSINANHGCLGQQVPCIYIETCIQNNPKTFSNIEGNRFHMSTTVGALKGQVECIAEHLSIPNATQTELDMIAQLLAEGIVV